jgi:uncharacterized phage protein gp47/JayE
MNYEEKTYEEIFEAALEDSLRNGLISKAEDFKSWIANKQDISNYYVMDKAVISQMIRTVYEAMTLVYNSIDLDICDGIDLDNIGKILGIPRPEPTKASVLVTFTLDDAELENDVNIDEGIIVSTAGGTEYETVDPLYIPVGDTSAIVQCMSVEPGSDVKVSAGDIVNIVTSLPYNFTVVNPNASHGGNDEYDDNDYRDLLSNWRKILIKGSEEAYDEFFANFDGIDGYKLIPNWDASGTMKIILDPGNPYLLNMAYEQIQSEVTQATEDVVMFPPSEKYIDIEAKVNVDIDQLNPYSNSEKLDIKNRIIQAIKVFINEGYRANGAWYTGLLIGEDFIPHKLAVFLDEEIPELKDINFDYPTNYIKILDDEIGVSRNIKIEMI